MTRLAPLGELEHLTLLSVLRLDDDAYGVSIVDDIAACTGRPVSRASVYIALSRLEAKGLLRSRLGDPSAERGGRAKRYFSATPAGVAILSESRSALLKMWSSIAARLRRT